MPGEQLERPADPRTAGRTHGSAVPAAVPATAFRTTVLASASPARLAVLRSAGIDPVVYVSGVDEPAVEAAHAHLGPAATVTALAAAKAEAVLSVVAREHPDAVVIGCDSMLLLGGTLRGKPADEAQARRDWAEMSGSTGDLLTGHAVIRLQGGTPVARSDGHERTGIRFGRPDEREITAYLATGEPLLVAGGLTIDGYGGWFVEGIDGDHSSVIGISLPLTRTLLAQVDVSVVDLWRPRLASRAAGPPDPGTGRTGVADRVR